MLLVGYGLARHVSGKKAVIYCAATPASRPKDGLRRNLVRKVARLEECGARGSDGLCL
jgi:hypothetical protein